jgi:putative tryptophan/tyrosine transport system substrate-binding protein
MTEVKHPRRVIAKSLALIFCALLLNFSLPAEAQQPKKVWRIGFLYPNSPSSYSARIDAFRDGLRDLGYVEGQNITIEYRGAAGKMDRLPVLAEELVRLNVDLIMAAATPAIQAAKNATRTIPIVVMASDAVGMAFATDLAHPGGNITGLTTMGPELGGKRLELLKEVVPKLSRLAFLAHGGDPSHELWVRETQNAAHKLGVQFQPLIIEGAQEFESAFSAMIKERADALGIQQLLINGEDGPRIANLAVRNRLPTTSDEPFAEVGGLISYGTNRPMLYRRAATFVDKILKGTKPADLPVEQPRKFDLVINLKTAKQIGVTIPQSVLYRADKVIK